MRSRSLLRLDSLFLAAALVLASERSSRAEEPERIAPPAELVFRATVPFAAEARLPDLLLPTARARAAASMTPTRLSKDEKIVIIVAACVVGAILIFATFQIGAHNHPF